MTRVLIAGVAVIDFVFRMESFPDKPEKYRADGAEIVGGGNAANAAVAISRLGGEALLASRLGDDQIADMILSDLNIEGIDCSLVHKFSHCRSSFSSIYLDAAGERQIMNFRDPDIPMDADWLLANMPSGFQAALADTRWPDAALALMKWARELGVPGIMDAESPVHEGILALEAASHVAFSAQGATELTGEKDVEKAALAAARQLPGLIVVTDGENGAVSVDQDQPTWHPAFKIDAIDTLGAGDVWHGAYALALSQGWPLAESIRFASAAAAIKCTRRGGRDGAPFLSDVQRFLEGTL